MTQTNGSATWFHNHPVLSVILIVIFIILFILAWFTLKRFKVSVKVTADLTGSYEEALARIEAIHGERS